MHELKLNHCTFHWKARNIKLELTFKDIRIYND